MTVIFLLNFSNNTIIQILKIYIYIRLLDLELRYFLGAEWGQFLLTEPVASLPGPESGLTFKLLEERPIE